MASKFNLPCVWGCGRDKVVSVQYNSCGRATCNSNRAEAHRDADNCVRSVNTAAEPVTWSKTLDKLCGKLCGLVGQALDKADKRRVTKWAENYAAARKQGLSKTDAVQWANGVSP